MVESNESYPEFARSFAARRHGVLLRIGVIGWGTYLLMDWVALGWASDNVTYRLVGELVLVATLLVHRTAFVRRHLDAVLGFTLCVMTFTTLLTIDSGAVASVEDAELRLQAGRFGTSLLFVAAAVIIPARLPAHLTIQALTLGFFAFLHRESFATVDTSTSVELLLGVFWFCFVCDFSIILYSRLQRSDFSARRELEELAEERKVQLDALEGIGITATSADPDEQARTALDEMIQALDVGCVWLYLRDEDGRSSFRLGRSAAGDNIDEPADEQGRVEIPLRMHDQHVGSIVLEAGAGWSEASAEEDAFLLALASHAAIALETVRTTEDLRRARDGALAAARAKDAFMRTMTHELRTPLNAMIGYSEMLQEDLEDQGHSEQAADAGKVHEASVGLLGVISDCLELADLESDRRVTLTSFPAEELVAELEATLRPLADQNENRLEFVVADDVGSICSDRAGLATILRKLLENACKFTHQGKILCRVHREASQGQKSLHVQVSDTGIGMTDEQAAKCFEPFYQADPSATREFGGTGLGLTTALRLSELLGGRLTAAGSAGEGSTFELTLPLA